MIALVLAMVWRRRGQAVTLALLSLFAVAAAVAAPAYLRAADQAVAAGQVRTALPDERGVELRALVDERTGSGGTVSFDDLGGALADLPGFDYIYAAEYATIGAEPSDRIRTRLVYRQDVCAHLTVVSGRCLIGEGEVVIGEQAARRLQLSAGDPVRLTFAEVTADRRDARFKPAGAPKPLTVAGVYRVPRPGATYWGAHGYFARDAGDRPGEPFFTGAATMAAMDHGATLMSVDGRAGPDALRVDHLPRLRAGLANLTALAADLGPNITLTTAIPALLDRIDTGRSAARLLVPVIAVPLVLLACLTIYLAVGYGIEGRRPELAVVALRGARWWGRWWLAAGESLVPILAGALLGCVAGQLLVNAVAAARFPGVGTAPGLASLRLAPVVAAAALGAALLAQRRLLASPVADLLRRAPVATSAVRGVGLDVAVTVLAVVTGAQLFVTGGQLTGVGYLAPAFLILALALICARAARPVLTVVAVRALRRGRVGAALAGFQLTRRVGSVRLFTLLVAAVAVAGYATAAVDVAARGRAVTAGLGNGADRVVSVQPVSRGHLLTAVRTADPAGEFAMAVAQLPGGDGDRPAGLAVDTTRLATVPAWPDGAAPPGELARALRPAASAPVLLPGPDLTVDATTSGLAGTKPLRLSVSVSSLTGLGDDVVGLGELVDGPYTYQQRSEACREGCRLKGISLSSVAGVTAVTGRVLLRGLRVTAPDRAALPLDRLRHPARWRAADGGIRLTGTPDGLRIDVDAPDGLAAGTWIQPADVPDPLPVAAVGTPDYSAMAGFDGRVVPVTRVAGLPAVPQLGRPAVLADLEYAERWSTDAGPAVAPQVWLSRAAPADVLDRLAEHGLTVVDEVSIAQLRAQLDEQGPALALWFYVLAGGLATALAAGALLLAAAVDRDRRVEDLSALRAQGLSRRAVARATLWTYPTLVLAAVLAGVLITLLVWRLTGWALPLAGLDPPALPRPRWPHPLTLTAVAAALFAVLAGVAALAGRRTYREIR